MKAGILCLAILLSFVGQAQANENNFRSDDIREQEILSTWRLYFKNWGIEHPSPKRTKNYRNYAKYITKWVDYFEENEGLFGGRLPKYKDNHLIVAVIIECETGIYSKRIGSRGEVGLMQIWGKARAGHPRREIINNPELGIKLGIQWLAYSSTRCKKKQDIKLRWKKTLTQYGAGPKAVKSNGRCDIYSFARRRFRKTLQYRKKIRSLSIGK